MSRVRWRTERSEACPGRGPARITLRVLRRKKKRRSNRQPRAAARGRPPPWCPAAMAGGQGKEHAPATGARQHTARPVKDHSTYRGAQRPTRGVGARCPHAARQPTPAPRPARACAACPPARAGPATAVRQHRGLEGLTLTQEPYGSTVRSLARREESPQRAGAGRATGTVVTTPVGSPGRRGEPPRNRQERHSRLHPGAVAIRRAPWRGCGGEQESVARAERSGAGAFRCAPWGADW